MLTTQLFPAHCAASHMVPSHTGSTAGSVPSSAVPVDASTHALSGWHSHAVCGLWSSCSASAAHALIPTHPHSSCVTEQTAAVALQHPLKSEQQLMPPP
jgi:hypothetical protein